MVMKSCKLSKFGYEKIFLKKFGYEKMSLKTDGDEKLSLKNMVMKSSS
jgi:hypothetical protein